MDADVLQQLREILETGPGWLEVRTRLVALTPEGDDERYRPLVFAFGFLLLEQSRQERRVEAGGPFGPALSDGDWQFPPPLATVEYGDVAVWLEAADALDSPVAAARLHDLLWERRVQPRPDQHARTAVDAYLQLAELPHWHLVERSRCLSRALELSRAVNDADRFDAVSARCGSFVEKILDLEARGPGPAMTILRALVDLPADRRPPGLDAMLLATVKRFGDDPYLFDALAELRTRIARTDAQVALRREQVAHWREASTDGDNLGSSE